MGWHPSRCQLPAGGNFMVLVMIGGLTCLYAFAVAPVLPIGFWRLLFGCCQYGGALLALFCLYMLSYSDPGVVFHKHLLGPVWKAEALEREQQRKPPPPSRPPPDAQTECDSDTAGTPATGSESKSDEVVIDIRSLRQKGDSTTSTTHAAHRYNTLEEEEEAEDHDTVPPSYLFPGRELPSCGQCLHAISQIDRPGTPGYVRPEAVIGAAGSGPYVCLPPQNVVSDDRLQTFCVRCLVWRPPGSHHCSECGFCVSEFDHHCGVFDQCIAQRNHRWFTLLLGLAAWGCWIPMIAAGAAMALGTANQGTPFLAGAVGLYGLATVGIFVHRMFVLGGTRFYDTETLHAEIMRLQDHLAHDQTSSSNAQPGTQPTEDSDSGELSNQLWLQSVSAQLSALTCVHNAVNRIRWYHRIYNIFFRPTYMADLWEAALPESAFHNTVFPMCSSVADPRKQTLLQDEVRRERGGGDSVRMVSIGGDEETSLL